MSRPDWAALARTELRAWEPRSQLVVPATSIARPAVPVIDVHNHLGRWLSSDGDWIISDVSRLIDVMDTHDVRVIVNLDGMWGPEVTANVERYDSAYPGRFQTFCQLDWERLARPGGEAALIASLEDSVDRGARGVKVWKNLGLTVHDADGSTILPDDPRVIAVLTRAGELGLPVLIHTADPKAFFAPADVHNERLDELLEQPDWWFGDADRYPGFDRLLAAHAALVIACPGTQFIGAHAGGAAEDLGLVEALFARAKNYTIDTAGRMAELGRQPRRTKALIEAYPDRVLFGTDIYPAEAEQFELHYRFFESRDEGFDYAPGSPVPPQGRWSVSALGLDPATLKAVYAGNAERLLGLDRD